MSNTVSNTHIEQIDAAIDIAINYLHQHQLPNGEFMTYMAPDEAMQEWCVPDSITGVTAVIGHCLLPLQDRPIVDQMLTQATNFLSYQVMRGGVWNYFTKLHHLFKYLAPDIDDTVLICTLLSKRKVSFPDNTDILLQNQSSKGLFYTWFTLHPNFLKYSKTYWRLIARELKNPIKTLLYWTTRDHRRNDIDVIVNANCIFYMGYNKHTHAALRLIIDTIKNNKEKESDKWYLNPIVYYYFLSRLFELHIPDLDEIQNLLCCKIYKAIDSRNNFLNCSLELALALSALIRLEDNNENKINQYAQQLSKLQASTGAWERYELLSVPTRILVWGSEELTTGFAVEALNLYKNKILQKLGSSN